MTRASMGSLDPKGPYAEVIDVLWWVMLVLGVAVFVLFAVLLVVGLRRRPLASLDDTGSDTGPGDGRAPERPSVSWWLVGGGVVLPTVLLVAVFATTVWAMRAWPNTAGDGAVVVEVVGHQWWYEVHYPEQEVTVRNVMHIPVGERVELRLTSNDVIHSFWVPELGGKTDMLPEDTNVLVLQADESGTYRARCAEFCGLHHAKMQLTVVAEPRDRFTSWLAAQP